VLGSNSGDRFAKPKFHASQNLFEIATTPPQKYFQVCSLNDIVRIPRKETHNTSGGAYAKTHFVVYFACPLFNLQWVVSKAKANQRTRCARGHSDLDLWSMALWK